MRCTTDVNSSTMNGMHRQVIYRLRPGNAYSVWRLVLRALRSAYPEEK